MKIELRNSVFIRVASELDAEQLCLCALELALAAGRALGGNHHVLEQRSNRHRAHAAWSRREQRVARQRRRYLARA